MRKINKNQDNICDKGIQPLVTWFRTIPYSETNVRRAIHK